MSEIIKITKNNFEKEVLKSEKPILIDFWASWCRPCRTTAPELEAFANTHPEIIVGKINVDEEGELAAMFNVTNIPTLFLIENGKIKNKSVGAMTKEQIERSFLPLKVL